MNERVVVIGGGFGGLAAAIRLQALGMQVSLLEKRGRVGGRAYQFREGGYTFDMGPSLITAPRIIEAIFEAAGRRLHEFLELIPLDPFYRIYFHDGTHLDYSGDPDRMKAQMRRFNPADADRYDAFMESIEGMYEAVITDGLGGRPFDSVGAMLHFLPRAMKLRALTPVASYARRFFKDFRHQFLFSFHPLFLGGNPFRSPSVYIMIPYLERDQGVWFTRGGMYALVEALERLFRGQGGQIFTDHEVSEIVVRDGRAIGVRSGSTFFDADYVVSNADVAHTYRDLVRPTARRKWTDRRIESMDYTMSCFLLYLGVRQQYPALRHHTLILTQRYESLLRDIFDRKILPDDFSMYLHAPTRSDPGMAPLGGESLYVLVPVANLQSGIDWSEMAWPFADRILTFLERWGLLGLRDHVEVMRLYTPDDFARDLNAYHGNAFGLEPHLLQTAYFRPHNRSEDVRGLYIVGAGTHPGAGVPGVMLSAEATVRSIERDRGVRVKTAGI